MKRFFQRATILLLVFILSLVWCIFALGGASVLWLPQIMCVVLNKGRPLDAYLDFMDLALRDLQKLFER